MSETIVTKRCCRCKQIKAISEFQKNRLAKDGLQWQCKVCDKHSCRKYNQSQKGRDRAKTYKKRKAIVQAKYNRSEKGKVTRSKSQRKAGAMHPEKRKARHAIGNAVRFNTIPKPSTLKCSCGKQAEQYHHHEGYAKEHRLDVEAVCISCHHKIHYLLPSISATILRTPSGTG